MLQEGDGNLAAAVALYDECAQLWAFSHGADNKYTEGARNNAAQLRQRL